MIVKTQFLEELTMFKIINLKMKHRDTISYIMNTCSNNDIYMIRLTISIFITNDKMNIYVLRKICIYSIIKTKLTKEYQINMSLLLYIF